MQYTVNDDDWTTSGGLSGLPVMENEYRCAPQLPSSETPAMQCQAEPLLHSACLASVIDGRVVTCKSAIFLPAMGAFDQL